MIEAILLGKDRLNHYTTVYNDNELAGFSKINILIGANNSGKSRFLRTFFSYHDIRYKSSLFNLNAYNELIKSFKEALTEFFEIGKLSDEDTKHFLQDLKEIEYLDLSLNLEDKIKSYFSQIVNYRNNIISVVGYNHEVLSAQLIIIGNTYIEKFDSLYKRHDFKLKNIYIPTLRGLRNISGTQKQEDIYLNCTIRDYFSNKGLDGDIKDKIYTGLSLYEDTKKLLLGTKEDREKVKRFENFLKTSFFNNEEINIIPRIGQDVVYFRIGAHEEHPIYELGDGIQSLIILTYPLFFRQGEKINFFIEEPEQYLHPGFQRIFVETLLHFKDYQYFITTHSNHLLDLTLDKENISVYTFKKGYTETNNPIFTIENVENKNSNILESIGVRNSSVFLSNCTIWVEGITDRIYIRKYLEAYQSAQKIKYKEDLHYSFVEYGGNNITHWSFLEDTDSNHPNIEVERLCGKLFLISDKDGVDFELKPNAKSLRQKQLAAKLGDRYYCLKSREIENSLSSNVLKQTILEFERQNKEVSFKSTFSNDNVYQDKKIGTFIDTHTINAKKKYEDESGTIKDKLNFAKTAIKFIHKEEDLTVDAKELVTRIYQFIEKHNV